MGPEGPGRGSLVGRSGATTARAAALVNAAGTARIFQGVVHRADLIEARTRR